MTSWQAEDVVEELKQAYQVLFAQPDRSYRPSARSGFWPEVNRDAEELEELRRQALKDGFTKRIDVTPRKISRMEIVLLGQDDRPGWLMHYLGDQSGLRRVLQADALWRAGGLPAMEGCRRRKWAYSTFKRKRGKAATLIAERLNQEGVELPVLGFTGKQRGLAA